MSNYQPADCYFALENVTDDNIVIAICPKQIWDEEGNLDETFDLSSFDEDSVPDFLTDGWSAGYFSSDELTSEEIKEQMLDLGFDYNIELQSFINETLAEEETDEDYEDQEDEEDWDATPDYSLN